MTDYHTAGVTSKNNPISHKQIREIIELIKGMKVDKAIMRLEHVIEHKEAVPFKRYHRKVSHKPGMAAGRYPEKASNAVIMALKSAKNNALNKGLQEEKLIVKEGVVMMDISKRKRIRTSKGGFISSLRSTSFRIILAEEEGEKK